MRYFTPPAHENWRMVRAVPEADRLRLDWFPPDALATTWNVAMRSVVARRQRHGPPDVHEALAIGLLPPVKDGRATLHLSGGHQGDVFFVWEHEGDYASSDVAAVTRLRVEGDRVMGMACRVRPPRGEQDRAELLMYLLNRAEVSAAPPRPDVRDHAGAAACASLRAQLEGLDAGTARGDHASVAAIVAALGPCLLEAPLSRLAVDVATLAGWAAKRRAFEGEPAATTEAIDALRRALDDTDEDVYPETRARASQWLAEAYARRDGAGDLERASRAYTDVVRLAREENSALAWICLRAGVVETVLADRSERASAACDRHAQLAEASFAAARAMFETEHDLAGQVEIAIAQADSDRVLEGDERLARAARRYGEAWSLLTVGGARPHLPESRFHELAGHVFRAMRELDRTQFGPGPSDRAGVRARAALLRPLTATRALMLRPPAGGTAVTFEMAMSAALGPDVAFTYVGGALHPGGADWTVSTSETSDWQAAVEVLLRLADVVLLVPGYTPGMQWELRHVAEQGYLTRALLVMLPRSCDADAAGRWEGARAVASAFGLALPPYDDAGAFLRFGADGQPTHRLPFEAVWTPRAIVDALEDLLREPEEIQREEAEAERTLARFAESGTVVRIRGD
jgi:hypothetical protein